MISAILKTCAAAAALAGALAALQSTQAANAYDSATYAPIGASTSVPWGWVDFCQRYAGECDQGALPARDINLSATAISEIARVNQWVNAHVEPETDPDHWGLADRWDYPLDGKGDCEDYALLKRKMLIDAGYPRQALLMTVVKDGDEEGHAVLTVKTNKGEFVLDNLNDEMRPWTATGYRFVKRQSQTDQNVWLTIGPSLQARL
ncbi:MAG: transglutaminase-like cysteine peptidase [Hyphomicrobiales bacterium]|nr:transglutaminase-like cysteine peptidase [Hyphomicrobiales bacterium]